MEEEEFEQRRQGEAEEQVVYCAVGKEAGREWKANLLWVLANLPRTKRLVFLHLHRPASRINMMGAWVPVSQLAEQEVTASRQLEEGKIGKVLDDLLDICKSQKVNASKTIIASDDTARGLVQFIDDHGVTELVMGAASDRAYHRKMRAPRSKKALMVQRRANPCCKIWFVCKGNLICTREGSEGGHVAESSTTGSTSPREEGNAMEDLGGGSSKACEEEEAAASGVPLLREDDTEEEITPDDGSEEGALLCYEKVMKDAENLKREAYEESRRRQMAERDLAEANKVADEAERWHQREARRRKAVEEMVARERAEMERDRQQLDAMVDQIHKANDRSAQLEVQIASSERAMSELEARLQESYAILRSLRSPPSTGGGGVEEEEEEKLLPGAMTLEDRLATLPWHVRCAVAHRTCQALASLHAQGTVHGDVRPANILVFPVLGEDEVSSKLGTRRPLVGNNVAYASPRYLATGHLTPRCDLYSLGVVLLQLVTGKPAFLARKAAHDAAAAAKEWRDVVDPGWPLDRAREVALVALKCCDDDAQNKQHQSLLEEATNVLQDAISAAAPSDAPSYFLCPILKELMRDPQIAADGFSYEAEAIREWIHSGHDTSPMTNLRLPTRNLTPNHALRSAIQRWRQRFDRY